MDLYSRIVRPVLFGCDPERAHEVTLGLLSSPFGRAAIRVTGGATAEPALQQRVFGLDFENPLGLAAGLDKQGTAVAAWRALGFGFVEIGTVTPRPQPGNPRPRLFRLPQDHAIINRFGFNSAGAPAVARNIGDVRSPMRIGINVGKNKDTRNERAVDDYVRAIELLWERADYFVVNVSSPNTAGLRDLQDARALRDLVAQVVRRVQALSPGRPIPVLVKLSPDMNTADLLAAVDAAVEGGAAGLVATNTTTSRAGLRTQGALTREIGGLSGAPLRTVADSTCRVLFKHLDGRVPIIGVGGIADADDAYARIRSGASLVQIYTGLIYKGPAIIGDIVRGLASRLERDGLAHVRDAIGADVD